MCPLKIQTNNEMHPPRMLYRREMQSSKMYFSLLMEQLCLCKKSQTNYKLWLCEKPQTNYQLSKGASWL